MYRKVIEMFVGQACNTISQSVVISIISQDRNLVILQNLRVPYVKPLNLLPSPSDMWRTHILNLLSTFFFCFFLIFFRVGRGPAKRAFGETPHSIGETPHCTMLVNYCMKACRKLQDMEPEWRGLYNGHNLVPSSDRRQLD